MARWRLRFNLQEIDLRPGRIVLGRAAECPITIEDALVSRNHAELLITSSSVMIRDLGSRNGVRVNGVRIAQGRLACRAVS
jgi:pSer/pThr/pTyr-binding forkhead associated (FHA) protein